MPIFSSSSTFTWLNAVPPEVSDFASFLADVFKKGAFRDPEPLQQVAMGFSSLDNMFESDFPYANYEKGEYIAFNFRIDERKVPPSILRQYLHKAEKDYREEHDGKKPHYNEWREMKEGVELKLLSQVLPSPKSFQVVWNYPNTYLLFGSTQEKIIELFIEYFEKIFKIYPKRVDALTLALEDKKLNEKEKDFLTGLISRKSRELGKEIFLGSEFLTWAWFVSETENGHVIIDRENSFGLSTGNRIVLEQVVEGKKQKVLCSGPGRSLAEARTALKEGKHIKEAELELTVGENHYFLTLDTRLSGVKNLKTPPLAPSFEGEDPDGAFFEKMYFIDEVLRSFETLYHRFLTTRLSLAWERDILPALSNWIGIS